MENRSSGLLPVSVWVLRTSRDVVSAELGIMGPLAAVARWPVTTGDPLTRPLMRDGHRELDNNPVWGYRYVNVDIYCFNCYTYIGRETRHIYIPYIDGTPANPTITTVHQNCIVCDQQSTIPQRILYILHLTIRNILLTFE